MNATDDTLRSRTTGNPVVPRAAVTRNSHNLVTDDSSSEMRSRGSQPLLWAYGSEHISEEWSTEISKLPDTMNSPGFAVQKGKQTDTVWIGTERWKMVFDLPAEPDKVPGTRPALKRG